MTTPLSPAEFLVLSALTKAPRRVLSRNHLLDALSPGSDTPGERMVEEVVVSRLRKKLGDNPKSPKHIRTVTGFGYIFQPTEQPDPIVPESKEPPQRACTGAVQLVAKRERG